MSYILQENKNRICLITLNRPDKHNCLSKEMLTELKNLFIKIENDEQTRAVILTGAGEKSFCTGGDLKEFNALDKQGYYNWIKQGHELFNQIENCSRPVIAAINGYALGGGLELACAADFRIAANHAEFGMPEMQNGWLPGWGGLYRLQKLLGTARAKELIILGEWIDANKAEQIGLVTRSVELKNLKTTAFEMAKKCTNYDPVSLSLCKSALSGSAESAEAFDILSTFYAKFIKDKKIPDQ